ncbi:MULTISPECIES: ABC transporter ATP-binding protein [Sulfitobacter]|uniref:ABC transporter ATP-binding protein n=1 Tax=Sulfitobacter TaxID=60136 RepID=UPI000ECBEDCF|nr:ABC transporter ATP-binding protein [Sulfitobacter indolifex]HCQ58637.1 spermidine/putrescine ABC transporter ATP-binding protein [Sulfitobacter sp.]
MTDPILKLEHLHKRFGRATPARDFSMTVERGEFFTMLGPSGSGKSTVLRMIAGLEYPDSGSIVIDGRDMTSVPPWDRHLGMVFQQYAIFPHLDVAGNVGYGLRRENLSREETASRISELLTLVGLEGYESRNVNQLSGGEQQRVAIARALAPRPAILLLDEPLSALDEKIRREMQDELRSIQQRTGTTFIYVTHDQEEALTMSDRVAVLNEGRYVQCDRPEQIFHRPRTPFVARFFRGCNLLSADLDAQGEEVRMTLAGESLMIDRRGRRTDSGMVAVRGEAIQVRPVAETAGAPAGDGLTLRAEVTGVSFRGSYSNIELQLPNGQSLTAIHAAQSDHRVGDERAIHIAADDLIVLEADSD